MSFPKYPEYKDSGIDWLGEVPAHWRVCKLGFQYKVDLGKMLDAKRITGDALVPYLRNQDVQWGRINTDSLPVMDISEGELERYTVRHGDILVCEGGDVGRAALWAGSDRKVGFQKALHRLRPWTRGSQKSEYLLAVLFAAKISGYYDQDESKATIAHLPAEKFRQLRFPFPPAQEQQIIAAFLDHETARIDALVEEQKRLIELLNEKRQAVISHAVKSFGDGPAGKLGYYIDLLPGYAFPSSGFDHDTGVRLLRGVNVSVGSTRWDDVVYWPYDEKIRGLDEYWLKEGDLVIGMDRPWISSGARVARIKNSDLPALLLQRVARVRARNGLDQDFLELALSSQEFKDSIEADMTGVSVPHISPEQISSFRIALPKVDKQSEIVQEARRELDKLTQLLEEASINITLMQEHRSALISAAVTGKIDVRGWRADQQPEQSEVLMAAEERASYS
ncbi:hypothetical protein HOP52_08465 [Halomonas campisalis]|uniref:Type I restriction modification DNA specificity domain-containing protein n=1 Tax=Billgrantia campisalis TaxID=74661 RepID=A0ABS9P7M5_9GAMM|nr:restriction endonuclease subunit S [Halomonas campisalis]MCG6657786.1 hypothetical protein [Halomonas campisalis]MDR5862441.1 restriction endonuclease subunit S [Halomonas campisalis]